MGRRNQRNTKRLTPEQEAQRAHLRMVCAQLQHTKGLDDTVWHEQLRMLDGLAGNEGFDEPEEAPASEETQEAESQASDKEMTDGTSEEDSVLA